MKRRTLLAFGGRALRSAIVLFGGSRQTPDKIPGGVPLEGCRWCFIVTEISPEVDLHGLRCV